MAADLFPGLDLCLEPPLDYLLPHVFDTADKKLFKIVFLHRLSDFEGLVLGKFALHSLHIDFQLPNLVRIIGLKHLDVALNLLPDVLLIHARGEQYVQKLAEL